VIRGAELDQPDTVLERIETKSFRVKPDGAFDSAESPKLFSKLLVLIRGVEEAVTVGDLDH
jgi:hypothetical protein